MCQFTINLHVIVYILLFASTQGQERCPHSNDFLCGDGACISKEFLCDGSKECLDGSDETHNLCKHRSCSQTLDYIDHDADISAIPDLSTTGSEFRCNYGACIAHRFICDGIKHCIADGSDETKEICHLKKCRRSEFKCKYGACIPRRHVCDNRYHCADNSDETPEACLWRKRYCSSKSKFQCTYGACIIKRLKCNGILDCLDKSDETESECGFRPKDNSSFPPLQPTVSSNAPPGRRFPSIIPSIFIHPTTHTPKPNETEVESKCHAVRNTTRRVEILACGDSSDCNGKSLPLGTIMVVVCDEGSTPLRCTEIGWQHARDKSQLPRKYPCIEQTFEKGENSTSFSDSIKVFSENPADCGSIPPFTPNPWLVGLFRDGEFACTGTIIGPSLILTAGHCIVLNQASSDSVISPQKIKVQYYSDPSIKEKDFASVSSIRLHPDYSGGSSPTSDIALLILKEDLTQAKGLSSVCLDNDGKLLGIPAWTFNRTMGQSEYHWQLFQQTLNRECVNKATKCSRHLNIGEKQFCGVNRESQSYLHQGSSGGPYLILTLSNGHPKWMVAGVVSNSIHTSDCGVPHTVFTSVAKFNSWIIECGFEGKCI